MADYYALRSVESEHIDRLARGSAMNGAQRDLLEVWWLESVHRAVRARIEQITDRDHDAEMRRMMSRHRRQPARHLPRRLPGVVRKVLFQVTFNTVGPGGRTWIGNRHVAMRRHTFRLHWRP